MYYALTQQEYALMTEDATPEESMLYLILRKFADFRTGLFSHRSTKRVNLSFLADLMTRKSSQGKAELRYCHTEVRRFLDRLVDLGLVADITREDRTLKMRLPLVGSGKEESRQEKLSGKEPQKQAKPSVSVEPPKEVESPVNTASSLVVDEPENRMLSAEEDAEEWMLSNAKSEESFETLAAQGFADVSETSFSTKEPSQHKNQNLERTRERESLPSASENQTRQVQSETQPHHAASRLAGKTEKEEGEGSVALPQDEWMFPSLLRKISGKAILYAFSEKSKSIYHGWNLCGFSLDDIERAFYKVIERKMLITPDSVDTVLRKPVVKKVKGSWKPVKKDQTKGRLAL